MGNIGITGGTWEVISGLNEEIVFHSFTERSPQDLQQDRPIILVPMPLGSIEWSFRTFQVTSAKVWHAEFGEVRVRGSGFRARQFDAALHETSMNGGCLWGSWKYTGWVDRMFLGSTVHGWQCKVKDFACRIP